MSVSLIETGLLLGLYALFAGSYALAYGMARLVPRQSVFGAALAFYALHCAVSATIIVWAPLGVGWKALLLASSAAVFVIPPWAWRYLEGSHSREA